MKKQLLTAGLLLTALCSLHAQVTPLMLWEFNMRTDAKPHASQSWRAGGFLLYQINVAYNANGIPVSFSTSTPQPLTSSIDQYRNTSVVNNNALVSTTEEQEAGETAWIGSNRTTFYSNGTHDTAFLSETFNITTQQYETGDRATATYSGNVLTELNSYNWINNAWKHNTKQVIVYANNKRDSMIEYTPGQGGNFEQTGYTRYFYGSSGLDSILEYKGTAGVFIPEGRVTIDGHSQGKTSAFTMWDMDNNSWEESLKVTYEGTATGLADLYKNSISVYPNPATETLFVTLGENPLNASARITDLQGKTLLSKELSSAVSEIGLSTLDSGIYFITVTSNGKSTTSRFIRN